MSARLATRPLVRTRTGLAAAAATLAAAAVLWLLLFRAEAVAAVGVWGQSTAYGHCFLVLPVAAWLAWERRGRLGGQSPRPWPAAALVGLPLALAWFAAERLGVMEGRQLAAVGLLEVLALTVLGWRLWAAFAVPLLYLTFLVPFGAFLVQPLQAFTAGFIDLGLDMLRIPHVVTRFVIEIPAGTFRVAEACAGLRFLIAAVAFGVLYACTLYRSPARRVAFVAASVVVPIVANGLRALGIVVLGQALGSARAGAVDHILYGWLFFSLVIALLILAGLPFREDVPLVAPPPAEHAEPARRPGRLAMAAAASLLVAALAPAASALLARAPGPADAAAGARLLAALVAAPGCAAVAPGRFACQGLPIMASVRVFPPNAGAAALLAAGDAALSAAGDDAPVLARWHLGHGQPGDWAVGESAGAVVARALWVGGRPRASGLAVRLASALAGLTPGGPPAVLLTVSAAATPGRPLADAATALRTFLDGQSLGLAAAP